MTERERWRTDFERSHHAAQRIIVLTAIVLVGALLGYRASPSPEGPTSFSAITGAP